jgi:uridine phosphorylase
MERKEEECTSSDPTKLYYTNINLPFDSEGRMHHICVKAGEAANRVITVGDAARAERISHLLDGYPDNVQVVRSHRPGAFTTYTGTFNSVPVSIIATGIGFPKLDIMIRELRGVVSGPLLVVRYGTCGGVHPEATVGSVAVATSARYIYRNPDAFRKNADSKLKKYIFSEPVEPDAQLTEALTKCLKARLGRHILVGENGSADSFYSSQARPSPQHFEDLNENLFVELRTALPELFSLEMETFHLFDLAEVSVKPQATLRAAGAAIICANRANSIIITPEKIHSLETEGGRAVLEALTSIPLA